MNESLKKEKMRIAFVNDACEHLGVESLVAVLKESGYDVKVFVDQQYFNDENINIKWLHNIFDCKKKMVRALKAYKPDIIGFSVVSDSYPWACHAAQMIKREMDAPIIFGGIHPTSVPERVLKNSCVDMVCVGEGEYPILELVQSLEKGKIDCSIKNIWFKFDGKIIKNEVRPLVADLNSLPFPDKVSFYLNNPHYSKCYYIMASRGCPYTCSYCCHSYLRTMYSSKGKYFRQRSVDNIIKELEEAKKKHNIKIIRFFDDSLGANKLWLEEFSSKYAHEISLPFICYMHPNHVSKESIQLLKSAGCCEIELGVQSLNEDICKGTLKRYIPLQIIEQAIDLIQFYGISIVTDNIVGLPGQTEEDIIRMAEFYNMKRVNRVYFFWLRFYPKTAILEKVKEEGIIDDEEYERIMDGDFSRPFSRGGSTFVKEWVGFQFILLVISFLPVSVVDWMIKKRVYRQLSRIIKSPAILSILTGLTSSSVYDRLLLKQFFIRYNNLFQKKY